MYVCAGWLARGSGLANVSVGDLFGWVVCWSWQAAGYLHAVNMAWQLTMVTKMPQRWGTALGLSGAAVGPTWGCLRAVSCRYNFSYFRWRGTSFTKVVPKGVVSNSTAVFELAARAATIPPPS